MAKNGSAALEEYDAYAARVEAQRVKAHASVRRRGEGATPLNRPGDGRASVSERETMSERLVPNELSAVSENKRRTPAATPTEDADASFEFAPATADARAPATPRALSFLDTPVARTKLDLTDGSTTTTTTTTTTNAETTNAADDAAKPFAARAIPRPMGRQSPRQAPRRRRVRAQSRERSRADRTGSERPVAVRRNRRGGNLLLRLRSQASRRSRARVPTAAARARS